MILDFRFRILDFIAIAGLLVAQVAAAATKITFDELGVMSIDGKRTFVISFTLPPPPDGKTPDGREAFAELRDGGGNYMRIPPPEKWDQAGEAHIRRHLDAAAKHGMYGWITLRGIEVLPEGNSQREAKLRHIVKTFKDHPGTGGWKGSDEPAWGKVPPDHVTRAYRVIKEVDPHHPVIVLHAPRGSAESLVPYMEGCDITGADIYPLAYPPGNHSDLPNKKMSVVADETIKVTKAAQAADPRGKPIWMVLQVAWSGVVKPGKTLRFPTFPEQRYMTYTSIIHGARGLNYFGTAIEKSLSPEDAKLGFNWTYWRRVLRPVLEEINEKSPLHPALLAADSKLPVKISAGATDVDFCVREVGDDIFILAAKREGATAETTFSGLPVDGVGEVLYESPRTVTASGGAFTDWFAANEVHAYRFSRKSN